MKKLLLLLILIFIRVDVIAEPLQAGISVIENLPNSFYGTWRVVAKMDKQSGSVNFRPQSIDFWNLSRENNVINLNNPFTGASASVKLDYVEGNLIRFTRIGEYDVNKKLIDIVDLRLNGDTFTGINQITLETYSMIDNSLIDKDTALYIIKGEKVSGSSIVGE